LQSNLRGDVRAAFDDLLDPRLISLLYKRPQPLPARVEEDEDTEMELQNSLSQTISPANQEQNSIEELPQAEYMEI
jgi:hypothetical protein